ncbi:GntR family transcriptional regulator [Microbacterium sp. YY-01]|uniref:GntR family transcriptional regulator n=1 Tax=Microbacterium sp. YY-01 TaxID=3421634 RepID=UPI003D167EA9
MSKELRGQAPIELIRDTAIPLHEQIADHFRRNVRGNFWPPGYKLRAEADIAVDLRVARGTVRRALRDLVEEGILVQVHGRGTFVASNSAEDSEANGLHGSLLSNGERLERLGLYFVDDVLELQIVAESEQVGPFRGGSVMRFTRLRTLLEGPEALITTEVLLDEVPGIESLSEDDLASSPFHRLLREKWGVSLSYAERAYSAEIASESLAGRLGLPNGAAVLVHDQFTYNETGVCIEHSRAWTRTDRGSQTVRIKAVL